jgi:hypothetical protein
MLLHKADEHRFTAGISSFISSIFLKKWTNCTYKRIWYIPKSRNCSKMGVGLIYYYSVLSSHYSTKCRLWFALNKRSVLILKYEVFLISEISVGRKRIALKQHKPEYLYEQKRSSICYKGKKKHIFQRFIQSFLFCILNFVYVILTAQFLAKCLERYGSMRRSYNASPPLFRRTPRHPSCQCHEARGVIQPSGRLLYSYYVRVRFQCRALKSVVSLPAKKYAVKSGEAFYYNFTSFIWELWFWWTFNTCRDEMDYILWLVA